MVFEWRLDLPQQEALGNRDYEPTKKKQKKGPRPHLIDHGSDLFKALRAPRQVRLHGQQFLRAPGALSFPR